MNTIFRPLKRGEQLFYIHVPKCAGTSFISLVDEIFSISEILPEHFDIERLKNNYTNEQLQSYAFIRGHFPYWQLVPRLATTPRIITILRDPIDQFISYFQMCQRIPSTANSINDQLKVMSLDEVLDNPQISVYLANYATRLISDWKPSINLQVGQNDIQVAKARMDQFDFVGIMEDFTNSVDLFCYIFGYPAHGAQRQLNISPNRESRSTISPATLGRIAELQAPDIELYQHGKALFEEKLARMQDEKTWPGWNPLQLESISVGPKGDFHFERVSPGAGWYLAEPHPKFGLIRWTGPATSSQLQFKVSSDLPLELHFTIVTTISSTTLNSLTCTVNGKQLTLHKSKTAETKIGNTFVADLPTSLLRAQEGLLTIVFSIASTAKPASSNTIGGDQRELGLCFSSLGLRYAKTTEPHIALWTPLPPLKTGIADYIMELLPYLAQQFKVSIFTDQVPFDRSLIDNKIKVYHYDEYQRCKSENPFDLNVYQMGNNYFHTYIYDQAISEPGLVVLHDYSLSMMLYEYYVGSLNNLELFKSELDYSEGDIALHTFSTIYDSGDQQLMTAFLGETPMLRRLVQRSWAFMGHLEFCMQRLKSKYQALHTYSMYLGSPDPFLILPGQTKQTARQFLGVNQDLYLIASFGHIQATKQNDVSLRAFARVCKSFPQLRLVLVGESNPESPYHTELQTLIASLGLKDLVTITGYVDMVTMQYYYLACDLVINLRYPSFGQMSATLSRAIASGKPSIITDLPEWQFLPAEFCSRVAGTDIEGHELSKHIVQFIRNPQLGIDQGQRARNFFLEQGNTSYAAQKCSEIINDVIVNNPKSTQVLTEPWDPNRGQSTLQNRFLQWEKARAGLSRRPFMLGLLRLSVFGKLLHRFIRLFDTLFTIKSRRKTEQYWNLAIFQKLEQAEQQISRLESRVQQLQNDQSISNRELRQRITLPELQVIDNPLSELLRSKDNTAFTALQMEYILRGPEAVITARQKVVLMHLLPTIKHRQLPIVDLGCGRGEFLALLKDEGLVAYGIEKDLTHAQVAIDKGLNVHLEDLFQHLSSLKMQSLGGICGFHIFEHLNFEQQGQLLKLSAKVLAPGGFLYLESPNAICLESLARFHADPTHVQPLYMEQLALLIHQHGFVDQKACFLAPLGITGQLQSDLWQTKYQDFGILCYKAME